MIENKVELFKKGIAIFAVQVVGHDRAVYTTCMVHQNGYLEAAKEFYKNSGYLKAEERDALFNQDVMPTWMADALIEVETKIFGISIWDKQ